ncbi:MAG: ABC transporter permease [Woeseiaceae bacterium]|nr:ABC transporter permease [Woeseiaceae bacterium]
MFWNNVTIALRNLRKNKVFAAINILGLALGMTIYVLAGLIAKYEDTHDAFFANSHRTYTLGVNAAPGLNVGIDKMNVVQSALGPIVAGELTDVDAVARTIRNEYLVSRGDSSFYEAVNFADPELLEIFDFNYIAGDAKVLDVPTNLLITESQAIKYFGNTNVLGEVITFDNEYDFTIGAVIEDIPLNSHFVSSMIIDGTTGLFAPMQAFVTLTEEPLEGNWNNLSMGNMTYVMLPETLDGAWLQTQIDSIFERLVDDEVKEVVASFYVDPLTHANAAIWDAIGMPVITVIQLLGFLVLVIACVNYTNLATAQSLGRSREVGMRKTMGAGQMQLLTQFLVESLVIATIAMVIAIAAIEVLIPLMNNATNKAMTIDYLRTLPWLVATTALVGLLAGLYPAWLITRAAPIDALRDIARKGKKGSAMRSVMIGIQFGISAFMLALVAIVFIQNERVKESSYIFPRSEIYNLARLNVEDIRDRLDTLQYELEALPNVDSVAFSSQVPYEQSNSQRDYSTTPGDEAGEFRVNSMRVTPEFFGTYDIPLLAGRNIDKDIAGDVFDFETSETLNVIVNELTLARMGIDNPQDAINQRLFRNVGDDEDAGPLRELIIVGVVPTQNILGLFNEEKPWIFAYSPNAMRIASIRITGGSMLSTIEEIESVWKRVIPDYPVQGRFLDETFDDVYNVLKYMNMALGGFAFVALSLAMIGLFGLAAFMAAQRTKEIGVRKVLGASSAQIARLLVWQFSKPVMWALAVALPAAYVASKGYLDFFADRIESPIVILAVSGAIAVMLAWGTVAGHAIRIARANPVLALRYE